jgi:ribosomal-protein-serine acetyltransferase
MKEQRILFVDDNIHLKEIGLEDVNDIFSSIIKEKDYLEEWLPFVELSHKKSDIRFFVEHYLESDRLDATFTIYYHHFFVGIIGLKDTDPDNKKTEIGFWLSEFYQHKGIMTLSCKTLINYIFDEMKLNRIQLKAATENLKSQRVAERLGFKTEGIERDGELHKRGFVDLVVFSLLISDI